MLGMLSLTRVSHRRESAITPVSAAHPRGPETARRAGMRRTADVLVLLGLFVALWGISKISAGIAEPFDPATAPSAVETDPSALPYYAARSLLRMFIALAAAVAFSFAYATVAARVRGAERVLIPVLDVLQSVPVLGFLAATLPFWLALFPGSTLGLECAAIFAIFTGQVWNMTFAFYQSLISQPRELDEAARALSLSRWQRFWTLDAPSGAFPLVWNGMMSFGGGWFFLIASEVITSEQRSYALPGIGSYAAAASQRAEPGHLLLAAAVMVVLVIGVNFVFWRPLTAWAERFRIGDTGPAEPQRSAVYELLRRSAVPGALARLTRPLREGTDRAMRALGRTRRTTGTALPLPRWAGGALRILAAAAICVGAAVALGSVSRDVGLGEFGVAAWLGLATFARVLVVLVLGTLVWVPIGVWIGLSPRVTRIAQPIVQVLASFPANFLFPLIALALITTGVSLDIGGVLLMALGSQWYILFNVIAGAAAIPNDLREASRSLGLSRAETWRSLYGPAVFGSWVTGALTAAGGAWNASIVAEVVSYGDTMLTATGLGAYISEATQHGDGARVLVGVVVMSAFVVAANRLLWRRLYGLAEQRFSLTS